MIRLLRFLSGNAVIIGSIWFVVSCGTALSGDMCGGSKMKPGDVCVRSAEAPPPTQKRPPQRSAPHSI
jgi:hypothetical protein